MNKTDVLEVFSVDRHAPIEQLADLLKFSDDIPQTEVSAVGWDDKDIVVDELATFFPFHRNFDREWESVKGALTEGSLFHKGRLIVIRSANQSGAAGDNLKTVLEYIASVYDGSEKAPQARSALVLDGFTESSLQVGKDNFAVTRVEIPEGGKIDNVYHVQVSGKRNHTYYVNLVLKIFQRRDWYNVVELSGLGNAIPSIVSIAEILKRYKVATVHKIETSLVELSDGEGSRSLQKAKIVVLMDKIGSIPDIPEDAGDQVV